MNKPLHLRLSDVRGLRQLASDATVGVTDLVEAMHLTIQRTPGPLGRSPEGSTRGITGLVYRSVRGVTRLVGGGLDALLDALPPLLADRPSSAEREAVLAALNGVLGDYLEATANPLAIAACVRVDGTAIALEPESLRAAFPAATGRIVVLVHGLCMNDQQWQRDGHDHGRAFARDEGFTPVYLHYNTGRHISANGRAVADLMEALLAAWPVPVERVALLGHSMGGLVARSALHAGTLAGHAWPRRIDDVVFLGTPHQGAPLERAGAWADFLLGISPYSAPFARLGKVRSAGIKDLRHGYLRDDDWQGAANHPRPTLALPDGVRCYAIAASRQARRGAPGARTRGDGLVPVASALGVHDDPAHDLGLPAARRHVAYATGHFELLGDRAVYARLRRWLGAGVRARTER
jgi:hypothetical protein